MPYSSVAVLLLSAASIASAQSGHWEGVVQAPDKEMKVVVDIVKNAKGEWQGTIAVPEQNVKGIPLEPISVKDSTVSFTLKGVPGGQSFEGPVSADGKSMNGSFSAGGMSFPAKFTRTGEAKFETPAKSTAISKDLEGDWEGALDANGTILHLKLHMANGGDGATGVLISVDQGGSEIPVSTITQKESHVKLEIAMVSGGFEGDASADRKQIVGTWTQGPGQLPLTFKRPGK